MKKQLFTIALLIAISSTVMAQSSSAGAGAFSNGANLFNVGIGLGSPFFGTGYSSSLPVNPTASFEHGVTDEISVGGQLSYASSKYDFSYLGLPSSYNIKFSAIYVGARGSYHLGSVVDLGKKFDLYGGASLGYVIVSESVNAGSSSTVVATAASGAGYGAFAGAKLYFSPAVGAYAELGYQSLSYLNIGLTFKF